MTFKSTDIIDWDLKIPTTTTLTLPTVNFATLPGFSKSLKTQVFNPKHLT